MSCGKFITEQLNTVGNKVIASAQGSTYVDKFLYTAYLGRVKVKVAASNDPNKVSLECMAGRSNDIVLRVIDAVVGRVDYQTRPTLRQLSGIHAAVVNISENKETFYQIQQMEALKANMSGDTIAFAYHQKYLQKFQHEEPQLYRTLERKYSSARYDPEALRALYVKNCCVDIHFQTSLFLKFLQEKLNRDSINNGKLLLSLFNVPDMDNAFFSGEYMLYGNGKTMFYPLSAIDVAAHELTHGLVQSTAGLEYLGHSGALNESFSDVMGTAFEFWLYKRFNENTDTTDDLQGDADWLIGEDIGQTVKYLRNMRDPTQADQPQPKTYRGQHWSDPNNEQRDYGGVHINSGVTNHCFYQFSQKFGIDTSLPIFYNCLLKLGRNSDFIDFRNTIIECTPEQARPQAQQCLDLVGLTTNAVSDWRKSPAKNKTPGQPNPQPQPQPPHGQVVPFPNPQVPYIRGLCCPHCLCLQRNAGPSRRRVFAEISQGASDEDYDEGDQSSDAGDEGDQSSDDELILPRRSKRLKR
jgi:hypothetical protein